MSVVSAIRARHGPTALTLTPLELIDHLARICPVEIAIVIGNEGRGLDLGFDGDLDDDAKGRGSGQRRRQWLAGAWLVRGGRSGTGALTLSGQSLAAVLIRS